MSENKNKRRSNATIINDSENIENFSGYYGISNRILKLINPDLTDKLSELLNKTGHEMEVPNYWKIIRIIVIPKPDKDLNGITNYRLITLISTLAKIFNPIII